MSDRRHKKPFCITGMLAFTLYNDKHFLLKDMFPKKETQKYLKKFKYHFFYEEIMSWHEGICWH